MKKLFYLFTFAIMIIIGMSGCNRQNYRAEFYDKDGNLIETQKISDYNDTLAYLTAYRDYCSKIKVEKDMQKNYGDEIKTNSFKVFKDDGTDITRIEFKTKKEEESKIIAFYEEMEDVIGGPNVDPTKIDSIKIKELSPYFNFEKDEFDVRRTQFIKPKSAPKFINKNAVYFYFGEINGVVGNLRLKIQYYAKNWLFIEKYIFNIDGFPIEFIPSVVKRDNDSMIWEWSDEEMTPFEASLIDALEYCKTVKIKFVGRDYSDVRTLSAKEVTDIKRAIELYKAKGGSI